jgi:hypothetical protein
MERSYGASSAVPLSAEEESNPTKIEAQRDLTASSKEFIGEFDPDAVLTIEKDEMDEPA